MQVQPRELCFPDNLKLVSPKDPSDLKSKCLLCANVNKLMAKFYKNIPSNEIHQFFSQNAILQESYPGKVE